MAQKIATTDASIAAEPPVSSKDHIIGIDTLRAAAALVVMLDHLGLVPEDVFTGHKSGLLGAANLVTNCLFNGPAAVVIFFIVSGFFIHLPQTRSAEELNVPRFYVRRGVRIGVPAICAAILFLAVGEMQRLSQINETVLWSITCEAIYYLLYPAILLLGRRLGWVQLVAATYVIAFGFCLTHLDALRAGQNAYIALGPLTWIVGLPCWILGCWLAEHRHRFRPTTQTRIWLLRIGIFALAFCLRVVKFHVHSPLFSNCFTLNLFALPVAAWIGTELASGGRVGTSRLLEWIGQWSYSIYLVHSPVPLLLAKLGVPQRMRAEWYHLLILTVALVLSYCFYRAVEKPAHRLAIGLSRRTPRLAWAAI